MQHNVDAYTVNLPATLVFYFFAKKKKREKKNDMSFQFNYLFFLRLGLVSLASINSFRATETSRSDVWQDSVHPYKLADINNPSQTQSCSDDCQTSVGRVLG